MKNLFYAKLADIVLQLLATIIPFLYYTYREEDYVIVGIYFCLGAVQVISAIRQVGKRSQFYWNRYRTYYYKILKIILFIALIIAVVWLLSIAIDFFSIVIVLSFIYVYIIYICSWLIAFFYFIISVQETRKLYFRAFHKPIIR